MRYCFPNGQLDMICKDKPEKCACAIKTLVWILPNQLPNDYSIIFWPLGLFLEGKGTPENIYALDTGCCWGGVLTLSTLGRQTLFYPT